MSTDPRAPLTLSGPALPEGDPSLETIYRGRDKVAGYWTGSAGGEIAHWRERALTSEAEVRRLRALVETHRAQP